MKKVLMIIVLNLVMSAFIFAGQKHQFGIGIGGGTFSSGLSGKYNMAKGTALQGILGARGAYGFSLGLDFIVNMPPDLLKNRDVELSWYAGAGGSIWHYSHTAAGHDYSWNTIAVSGVVGLSLMLQKVPLEFSLEWRPSFYISGDDGKNDGFNSGYSGIALFELGANIRWFF